MSEENKLLDEAINWVRDMAYGDLCDMNLVTAQRYENIANWLEELKEARQGFNENRKAGYRHGLKDGYTKAIDNFAEKIRDICSNHSIGADSKNNNEPLYAHKDGTWHSLIDDVTEQLKEGSADHE